MLMLNNPTQREELKELVDKYRKPIIKSESDVERNSKKKVLQNKTTKNNCICSGKFFNKWKNCTRSEYLSALAAPKPIRLRPWPNPLLEVTLPIEVSKAAMYGKIPDRIHVLAIPKRKKIISTSEVSPTHSKPSLTSMTVKHYTKRRISRSRIEFLSKPKPYLSRYVHNRCLNTDNQEKIYYKPKRVTIKSPEELINHQKWLKKNAAPKKVSTVPFKFINTQKMTKSQMIESSDRLSKLPENKQFVRKLVVRTTEPRPHGRIIPINKDWVTRLSKPKKLSSETMLNLNYDPNVIPRSALKAKLTKRIKELAEPKEKRDTEKDIELKENPFKVALSALKYKATKRIIQLAQPRRRGRRKK